MRQFMLILQEQPQDFLHVTPAEMQGIIERYVAWRDELAARDRIVDGNKLREEGGRLLIRGNGGPRVTDGAYAEAKEVIGGYFVIRARDYDEAVEIASSCPHMEHGTILVRQVDETSVPDGN